MTYVCFFGQNLGLILFIEVVERAYSKPFGIFKILQGNRTSEFAAKTIFFKKIMFFNVIYNFKHLEIILHILDLLNPNVDYV